MKVRFALLADYSNVTQEGKINILGLFDFIIAAQFPATIPEIRLVVRFEADISEQGQQKEVQVRLIDEHGGKMIELNGRIPVVEAESGPMLFIDQILILRNITFPSAGDYQFDIYVDDKLSSVPLKAVLNPQLHKP